MYHEPIRDGGKRQCPLLCAGPMTYQSSLLTLLQSRDYIHQLTDAEALDALAAKQVVTGYIGFRSEERGVGKEC